MNLHPRHNRYIRAPRLPLGAPYLRGGPPSCAAAILCAALVTCLSGCEGLHVWGARDATITHRIDPYVRAKDAFRAGRKLERQGVDAAVDRYYEASVFAWAAMGQCGGDFYTNAQELHNAALASALRTAQCFGRIDARSHLLVNGPGGSLTVPIQHFGFVWKPTDFHTILDTAATKGDARSKRRHCRPGLGAPVVVARQNHCSERDDVFLKSRAYFAATAVLRPDIEAWLSGARPPCDRLEFHDPYRVACVGGPRTLRPLAADFDASFNYQAEEFNQVGNFRWIGLFRPETEVNQSRLTLQEPFQPGKIPIVLIHGLIDDQFNFTDMIIELRRRPGFSERYQLVYFNYATGIPFLSSAAILREQLHRFHAIYDPGSRDITQQQLVLIGYSMGGLLTKSQIVSSGEALRNLALRVPIDQLRTTEENRQAMRRRLVFEPVATVQTAIYIATPHRGSSIANRVVGRFTSLMVRRPEEGRQIIDEVDRTNPGVVTPLLRKLPSSVDLLLSNSPVLAAIEGRPRAPRVVEHTILGTAHRGLGGPKGDFVVPVESASIQTSATETWIDASHFDIAPNIETIARVAQILGLP